MSIIKDKMRDQLQQFGDVMRQVEEDQGPSQGSPGTQVEGRQESGTPKLTW